MKIFTGFVVTFFLFGGIVQAADITFNSSGSITSSDVFDNVYVQNNGTIVDMSGGQINSVVTYDATTFNMSGGHISNYIGIGPLSTINVSDGVISLPSDFYVEGVGSITGGNISADRLKSGVNPNLEILGGTLHFGIVDLRGNLTIKGGSLQVDNSYIDYFNYLATINIYGYGFNYNPYGGAFGEGILTGHLLDDNAFTFDGLSELEYSRFNLIPEPASLCLLALGGLFLRRKF